MNLTEAINNLVGGGTLKTEAMDTIASAVMKGDANRSQVAAILTALRMRGETADDLTAFARQMRALALPFQAPEGIVLDTCGTGGDLSGTFNISTAAAFVAAGAGVRVAKHGNRSMTSKCGSADVLTELGVNIDRDTPVMERALAEAGICFLFAQRYHSSMKHVAQVRQELGFRTIFNLLGPLANPAGATHQLIGVFGPDKVELVAQALRRLGTVRGLVVHGADGLDEITTTDVTTIAEVSRDDVKVSAIHPRDFSISVATREALAGGDSKLNAAIILDVLNGKPGAPLDIVLLNAAATIYVAEKADSLKSGLELARHSIGSGAALGALNSLKRITNET